MIAEVRGEGLMFGLKTRVANLEFMAAARKAGLLRSRPATMSCACCRR